MNRAVSQSSTRVAGPFREIPFYQNPQQPAVRIVVKGLLGQWLQPQRRAAFWALAKATMVIAALGEYVWLWHTRFYLRHFPEVPISLAWSLLTVIGGITFAQVGCSAVLKARSTRLRIEAAALSQRLTAMLAEYISNGDCEEELNRLAVESTNTFEDCMTVALLSTRGAAHERICELPAMAILRDRWISKLHNRKEQDRRYSVEHLALLRDPQATMALEYMLDDKSEGVVAAAARGLLSMPGYSGREALVRSLPSRPYFVRVLTAGESIPSRNCTSIGRDVPFQEPQARNLILRHLELQRRAQAVEEAILSRRPEAARIGCSVLAASGAKGRDVLRTMSATGTGGEAPAEALGGLLAAAARGGRA